MKEVVVVLCFCPQQNVKLGTFHIVVAQQWLRSVQKSVVVLPILAIGFLPFSLPSLLELPIFKNILLATFQSGVSYINCCFFCVGVYCISTSSFNRS